MVALLTLTTDEHAGMADLPHHHRVDMRRYLDQVRCRCAESSSGRTIPLTESHRPSMIRTLTRTSATEFKHTIESVRLDIEWDRAIAFCRQHLLSLDDDTHSYDLQHLPSPKERFRHPAKWFNYMAKGKEYKGVFRDRLAKENPELIRAYCDATSSIHDHDVLRQVLQASDYQYKEAALQCLDAKLFRENPCSRGDTRGKQTEVDLLHFLRVQYRELHDDTVPCNRRLLLQNVCVQPPTTSNSIKSLSRKRATIETKMVVEGMTSEFDALLVERVAPHKLRIVQVWEAKATIHPLTIHDAFVKKETSIQAILGDADSKLLVEGICYDIIGPPPSVIGLYGASLSSPEKAANMMWAVVSQRILSLDLAAVLESLQTGSIGVPMAEVMRTLDKLVHAIENCTLVEQSIVIVASDDGELVSTQVDTGV